MLPAVKRGADPGNNGLPSAERVVLHQPLMQHFRRRDGALENNTLWDKLSDADSEKYRDLVYNAGTPPDPSIERKKNLLLIARDKQRVAEAIRLYQSERQVAGLGPDSDIELHGR